MAGCFSSVLNDSRCFCISGSSIPASRIMALSATTYKRHLDDSSTIPISFHLMYSPIYIYIYIWIASTFDIWLLRSLEQLSSWVSSTKLPSTIFSILRLYFTNVTTKTSTLQQTCSQIRHKVLAFNVTPSYKFPSIDILCARFENHPLERPQMLGQRE